MCSPPCLSSNDHWLQIAEAKPTILPAKQANFSLPTFIIVTVSSAWNTHTNIHMYTYLMPHTCTVHSYILRMYACMYTHPYHRPTNQVRVSTHCQRAGLREAGGMCQHPQRILDRIPGRPFPQDPTRIPWSVGEAASRYWWSLEKPLMLRWDGKERYDLVPYVGI